MYILYVQTARTDSRNAVFFFIFSQKKLQNSGIFGHPLLTNHTFSRTPPPCQNARQNHDKMVLRCPRPKLGTSSTYYMYGQHAPALVPDKAQKSPEPAQIDRTNRPLSPSVFLSPIPFPYTLTVPKTVYVSAREFCFAAARLRYNSRAHFFNCLGPRKTI